jgi:hypothetical protein
MGGAFIPLLGSLLDRLLPDPKIAAEAKLEVMRMAQAGELAQLDADLKLATGQIDINKVEAASQSLFVSGWRPAIGWVCGAAFAFKFILGPAAVVVMAMVGHPITIPTFDFTEMSTILLALLGLGGFRTVEKVKGV